MYPRQILHGRQHISPDKRLPTTYYSAEGGAAGKTLLAKAKPGTPLKVGVIGIGVGTLATYGRPGDTYRLYDIDPMVIGDTAEKYFSFLSDGRANTEIVLGDARLQLEREAPQQFDVLVVDAFSGDSVPVHLLTGKPFSSTSATSNRMACWPYIATATSTCVQVIKTAADFLKRPSRIVDFDGDEDRGIYRSRWAIIAQDDTFFCNDGFSDAKLLADKPGFRPLAGRLQQSARHC